MVDFDLSRLTQGERMWLWRRGQQSPSGRRVGRGGSWMSAAEAASERGIKVKDYCAMENDNMGGNCEVVAPQPLSTALLCLLARRRAGVPLDALCAELAISKPTYHRLERLGHPDIVDLWRRRGFKFPED